MAEDKAKGGADVNIKTEELKTVVPRLQDISIGLSTLSAYLKNAKAQPNHFGNTQNGPPAGSFSRQSIDAIATSVTTAQQYAASLVTTLQQAVGMIQDTEAKNQQAFKNQAV